jgi:glycosyltransferase involved in cell wall biosynthesis
MSIRFSWLSNAPWSPSGYGQQTRINVHRLANETTGNYAGIICYFGLEGGMMGVSPHITCFPKRYHPYGADVFFGHSQAFGAQVAFSLTDVWVIEPENFPLGFKWIPWYPVDHEPMPPGVRMKLNNAWKRIAMSQFGVTQTHLMGLDCMYVPHGIETAILKPVDRAEARKELGIPADAFVCGMVAMNKGLPSRKNFVEQIAAFANIHRRHKDTYLYLQTEDGRSGGDLVNLPELCRSLGLEENKDYGFCNQYNLAFGFPVEYMPKVYSSLDVLLAVGAGEGFGIPIIEAQACGCPVIVGDWTAMPELVNTGQLIAKKDAFPQYSAFGSFLFRPHVRAVELAIEAVRKHPGCPQTTIQWIHDNYDADVVLEKYWKPVFAEIEAAL